MIMSMREKRTVTPRAPARTSCVHGCRVSVLYAVTAMEAERLRKLSLMADQSSEKHRMKAGWRGRGRGRSREEEDRD